MIIFMNDFSARCLETRKNSVSMFLASGSGHLASSLSIIEILVTLYYYEMDLKKDHFILSKGHGCLGLYAILGQLDFFSREEWKKVGKPGGILGGHPSSEKVPGIEISSGSLGLSPSVAVGLALAERLKSSSARVFCLLGDGELNEGSVWEAAMSASQHQLDQLNFFVDCNGFQAFGKTDEVWNLKSISEKWRAFGWKAFDVDLTENPMALFSSLENAAADKGAPKIFVCKTKKGMGLEKLEGNPSWHNKTSLNAEERAYLLGYINS